MDAPQPNYRREFFKSPHHIWFGLCTLGAGFMTGEPLYLLAGATVYALGWIYIPDFGFFRRWVDKRQDAQRMDAEQAELAAFFAKRNSILSELSSVRRARYEALTQVCQDIEQASRGNPLATGDVATDPRLKKLDELMWTYLRLLSIEESLERFLETERRDDVPTLVREADREVGELSAEIEQAKKEGRSQTLEPRQRLLNSRLERLDVLHKRLHRIEQGRANLALVISEQERLEEQIKLVRADALASKNAGSLSARIDATVEHLDQTNRWISELDEFKDLVGDVPDTQARVGYQGNAAPPVIDGAGRQHKQSASNRVKQF